MKKIAFGALLLALPLIQGCRVGVGYSSGHWRHTHYGYYDRYGYYHSGYRGWSNGTTQAHENGAQELATKYGLREESAKAIINALGADDAAQAATAHGVNPDDLAALAQAQMPSQSSIDNVAVALREDSSSVRNMMSDYVSQVRDINSNYWNECVEAGHWTTPQNVSCEQVFWKGCAPSTGATSCNIE